MSQENVEVVKASYEAFARGGLDRYMEHFTDDVVYRGRGGFQQFWRTFREPWETLLIEVERIEPIGDDQVLGLLWFHGRGRDGLDVRLKYANLYTVEGGMVSRLVGFADWQQGLEAAGLRE